MTIVRGKAKNINEICKRRFSADVRKTKYVCEELDLYLHSNKDSNVNQNDICILSQNEYNIGLEFKDCDINVKAYFLSPEDYEVYKSIRGELD